MAQTKESDNIKTIMGSNAIDTLRTDSAKVVEDAPLDIAQNRGLFIVTPDKKMQLRILGSVRYLVVFDQTRQDNKNSFSTFEILTGNGVQKIPNYYNGLDQSRLGFEVTRQTNGGNVFIRLETDFVGVNGFRIRHAYGQLGKFLLGQTWSLFSHINALPSVVDFAGPTGSVVVRTPQVRFSVPNLFGKIDFAVGLEYFPPDINIPDSLFIQSFQLIPDITVRFDRSFEWGNIQVSGILPTLSGTENNEVVIINGWGVSGSLVINFWKGGKWYFQGVAGKAIARYFDDLGGSGFDIRISPGGNYITPFSYGFYGSYEHSWTKKVYSNFTYGTTVLQTEELQNGEIYNRGHSLRMNTFWNITDGAKAGGEIIWGNRVNLNNSRGDTFRFNLLFYYDF